MSTVSYFPETGKIQSVFFKDLVFPFCGARRSEVIVGPQYGVDVSIVQLDNGLAMAMTSDPLSLIPTLGLRESAWLSVQLMANDLATTGVAPQYGQFVLTLPTSISAADFEQYWKYVHEFCSRLGIAITGGHTGRFEGQNSTIAGGGTLVAVAPAEHMLTSKGARPGDVVLVTKSSGMAAVSILAMSFPNRVKELLGRDMQHAAAALFYETSAVEAGVTLGELNRHVPSVTAMHDVTEGGIIGCLRELAEASDCGMSILFDRIPVTDVQLKVGDLFSLDPRYCVGAGSMVVTAKADKAHVVMEALARKGIPATVVGEVTRKNDGFQLHSGDGNPVPTIQGADPYWQAFNQAWRDGWN